MKERTGEMERAALLRRIKRLGVNEVAWRTGEGGGVQLSARLQVGRAHRQLVTGEHDDQDAALAELADLAGAAVGGCRQRPARAETSQLHRKEAGVAAGPVDDRPLGERTDELPPARHKAQQARLDAKRALDRQRRAGAQAGGPVRRGQQRQGKQG